MGVQGLWELLAPVGRRVSVETLAGKRLAIDASIWMVQFMKAMRDEKGEMVRNAHLLGFFRRICKLLFLRTKPVFVFDGGTPALKRRTVVARRRQRDNAQAKIRKTAEKLLLNHLKARKLEELAKDTQIRKAKDSSKGKQVLPDYDDLKENNPKRNETDNRTYNQESLDQLLAASLAAEENGNFTGNASTSMLGNPSEEEDDGDENEEMIFPVMPGKVDPTVLAALPPSMQLDLLVQMREQLMAENRQKYQKVKKAPSKFSELQIQAYLKTVAFRREIDVVQKSAAGREVGGMQASRIASEPNREFIFSSSFTGDKRILTSAGVEENGDAEHQTLGKEPAHSASVDSISSTSQIHSVAVADVDEPTRGFNPDVETYIDDRGRIRVSRLRGLGIRMTRDLQHNLDLMKEFEQEKQKENSWAYAEAIGRSNILGVSKVLPENNDAPEASIGDEANDETVNLIGRTDGPLIQEGENHHSHEQSTHGGKTSIEISFFEGDNGPSGTDVDDLFACLVTGSSKFSSESFPSGKYSCDISSDSALAEGVLDEGSFRNNVEERQPSLLDDSNCDEGEVDWEEGVCQVPTNVSTSPTEHQKAVSRGFLEEEAEVQEAIRRSLEDIGKEKSILLSSGRKDVENYKDMVHSPNVPFKNGIVRSQKSHESVKRFGRLENGDQRDILQINDSLDKQLASSIKLGVRTDGKSVEMDKDGQIYKACNVGVCKDRSDCIETPYSDLVNLEPMEAPITGQEQCLYNPNQGKSIPSFTDCTDGSSKEGSSTEKMATENDREREPISEKIDSILPDEGDKNIHNLNLEFQAEASETSLDEEMLLLQQERMDLGDEQRKLERNAESVSSEMFAECQELLQMFGLPYIIAPMEAEAQCAFMELTNLVDGVVTDDSDVFLFGARSVYKNIFDDRKYVETYFMKDIESELGLTREKLIRMALLLGSDYTEGISGIGIVNAIEVVHAFPEEDGLQKFREWLESPDPAIFGKLDAHIGSNLQKRSSKVRNNVENGSANNLDDSAPDEGVIKGRDDQQSVDNLSNIKQIFMDKHRNVSKNWHIPSSFPSESVISAYTSPQVDKSTEPFSWGKPDQFVLRKLCWERFGWSNQKADELLVPVLKEYSKHETQLRLEAFYTFNERFAKIRSKRIKKAVKGITGNQASDLMDDLPQEGSKSTKRRNARPSGTEKNTSEISSSGKKDDAAENEGTAMEKAASKQPSKRNTGSQFKQSAAGRSELSTTVRRGKGRGRGRRRGRGRGRKEAPSFESSETSTSGGDDGNDEKEMQDDMTKELSKLRRSTRSRKQVEDAAKDLDVDSPSCSSNQSDDDFLGERAVDQEPFSYQGTVGDAHGPNDRNQGLECPAADDSSRDYLFSGGGFCMDDDSGQSNDPIQTFPSPTKASDEHLNGGRTGSFEPSQSSNDKHLSGNDCPVNIDEAPQEKNPHEGHKDVGSRILPPQITEERDTAMEEATVEAGLIAMPSLRRKRRKT